jgi:hypothetical protein
VIGLAPNAAGVIGGILTGTGAAEASGNSPTLTLVIALLGGGIGVSLMNAIIRRRTGEDRADAADALSTGAQQLAHGAQQLIAPLNQQIIELTKKNAELESKLGAARRETADRAIEAADMQREILRIQGERDQQHNLATSSTRCRSRPVTPATVALPAELPARERASRIGSPRGGRGPADTLHPGPREVHPCCKT